MRQAVSDLDFTLLEGDVRDVLVELPGDSVHCCVTSPPYWCQRDYGIEGQLGLESTPAEYVACMVEVFRQVRRILRPDGTLWLNLGDSFHAKQLVGIPWQVAFALKSDGWRLRSDIIWAKPNPMPESVKDRPTRSHEFLFLFAQSSRYFYATDAIREPLSEATIRRDRTPRGRRQNGGGSAESRKGIAYTTALGDMTSNPAGRNARSVWEIATQPYAEAHFATFPEELVRRCIAVGCPPGGTVLDPFMGAGTTASVARSLGRKSIGVELNPEYVTLAAHRLGRPPQEAIDLGRELARKHGW